MPGVDELLDQLQIEIKRTIEDPGVEAVHDLRVSVRRATEALRIFEHEVPRARRIRKSIKQIREMAAPVRDRDITRQLLLRHRLPPTDPALIYLAGQRDYAAAQLRAFLVEKVRQK